MKKVISILGALLLVAGCFLPIITAPNQTFNFFDPSPVKLPDMPENAMMYAAIVLMAVAVSVVVLSLIGKTRFVWIGGIVAAGVLAIVYFGFHSQIARIKAQADQQVGNLFGGLFKGMTDSLFQAVELKGAGWYVLGAGAVLLLSSAFLKTKSNPSVTQS